MSEKLTLVQKLAKIQLELKAPKNQRNNFGGYNYRSAEDILEAVKPIAIKYDSVVNIYDEVVEVGGRIYVRATVRLINCDDATQVIMTTALAREEETKKGMDGSQITGAASSYARKYALNGMFAIDDTKDSDATNDHGRGQPQTQQKTASDLLGQTPAPKKPAPSSKAKKAWSDYCSHPANANLDKEVIKVNFGKMCVEVTGLAIMSKYSDAEWDKVIEYIGNFK